MLCLQLSHERNDLSAWHVHARAACAQMVWFQHDLIEQIGQHRSRGVIIDVAALDVIDSFATSTLRDLTQMARLGGAQTVIVDIQTDVAFALVELGMDTGTVSRALDLEEGLRYLEPAARPSPHRNGFAGRSP